MKTKIKIFTELTKIRITSFVTLTTAFGYVAAVGKIDENIISVLLGILILAFGSAALNHYHERNFDSLMTRTLNRPIPSGKISPKSALVFSISLILSGSIILFIGNGLLALSLGLLNLIWYNLIYTLLKRKTAFAIIPGSLVGAIPPMVGWVAAGGYIFDPQILVIAFFFFIWQIPHFWLLLLFLDKEYKLAGFPTLTSIFSREQLIRITFIWIISTVATGLLLPLFGLVHLEIISVLLFFSGLWLAWNAFELLKKSEGDPVFRIAFRNINVFALLVVFLISADKLII